MKKMTRMKFSQLSEKAQMRAVKDYLRGWEVTHENEEDALTEDEALDACRDTEHELFYTENGKLIEE